MIGSGLLGTESQFCGSHIGLGNQYRFLRFPFRGSHLDGSHPDRLPVLIQQADFHLASLTARRNPRKAGEVILLPLLQGNSVESVVLQSCSGLLDIQYGIMRIVFMNGSIRSDREASLSTGYAPGIVTVPLLMRTVFRRIFKIAVLYQLGIQATVGRIVDILKEDAYQVVADSLPFRGMYLNGGRHRLQSGKAYRILFGPFVIQLLPILLVLGIADQLFHNRIGHPLHPAVRLFTVHRYLYSLGRECRSRLIFPPVGLGKITLRSPLQQVGRSGMCQHLSAAGSRPYTMPRPVGRILPQMGGKHFLFTSPRAKIAFHVIVPVGHGKPLLPVGTPCKPQSALSVSSGVREKRYGVGDVRHLVRLRL